MQRLKQQILELLDKDKKDLHKIYARWVEDHAYLWEEFEDLEKLRELLLVIIKLFYHEHRQLQDINKVDYEEFRKDVRELLSNHNSLLQKARKAQVEEIEFFGLERWFEIFRKDIDKLNEIIERYEQKAQETHKVNDLITDGPSIRARIAELRTLNQLTERLAYFIIAAPLEASVGVSGLSDTDLNARFQSLKKSIEEDNTLLSAAFQDLHKSFGQTEPNFTNLTQAIDFFERKELYDSRINTATALQEEYRKKLLKQHKFPDIHKLQRELASKRSDRQDLEGRWLASKQKQKLDGEIKTLEAASREYDAVDITYINFNISELQKIALEQAVRLLKYYDILSNQTRQIGILNPQLLDSLLQEYIQKNFVLRSAYNTSKGPQVFSSLPPDERERIRDRTSKEFKQIAYFVAGNKNKEVINYLSESQKRAAQVLLNAITEMEKRRESGVDYNSSSRAQLRQDIHDILRREPYEDSLRRFVSGGITPEVWQTFSGRKEIADMYGTKTLEGFKMEAGAIIWEKLLVDPRHGNSVSAFALTPKNYTPFLVLNFWTQRDSHGESWAMREIGDVLSSFSEEEVRLMEGLGVPGLIDVVKTIRASPNALGTVGMLNTEEAHVIDEGLVKMCAHYLNNGTPEEKYFALKTATNLNCMILTGRDHIADPRLVRQREMLIPAIADIAKIPEADLREPRAIRETIPEIGFYFTFEDLKAGKGYSKD
ncbi:MAG: hypothetical protein AABX32_03190 [Nanoarchaeota archaeon]